MASVSRAFSQVRPRDGLVLGVLPGVDDARHGGTEADTGSAAPEGYPNPWVEVVLRTHLPLRGEQGAEVLSRNHINVLSSDVIVALPGGAGTASEVALALHYGRPIVAFLDHGEEIPDLPSGVPWTASLDAVQEFVLRHIPDTKG
jgi:predicted Rossmann-fold nucleotide-binding protein